MVRIVRSAIRMVIYGYSQGSFRKHFLNAGTSIVIPKISPKTTWKMNPMVCVANPDFRMVEISVGSIIIVSGSIKSHQTSTPKNHSADEASLHYTVGEHAAKKQIDLLLCVGTLSEEIVKGAKSVNPEMNAHLFASKEELLAKLPELLADKDSILIKASHFMQFEKIVAALQS